MNQSPASPHPTSLCSFPPLPAGLTKSRKCFATVSVCAHISASLVLFYPCLNTSGAVGEGVGCRARQSWCPVNAASPSWSITGVARWLPGPLDGKLRSAPWAHWQRQPGLLLPESLLQRSPNGAPFRFPTPHLQPLLPWSLTQL